MPLVVYGLEGMHIHACIHSRTKVIIRNQVRAWFKNNTTDPDCAECYYCIVPVYEKILANRLIPKDYYLVGEHLAL